MGKMNTSCTQLPQQITHPFDQNHVFSLLPKPIYPGGLFKCDACGKHGNGFSYHCGLCSIDLHTNCASMPLLLTHQSHHHQLNLTFSPPYHNKSFLCDVCTNVGDNHWLYRCSLCGFDAHLDCATTPPIQTPVPQIQFQQHQVRLGTTFQTRPPLQNNVAPAIPQFQVLGSQSQTGPLMNNYMAPRANMQNYVPNNGNPGAYASVGPVGGGQGNGQLNFRDLVRMSESFSQTAQTLVQGLMGGSGGGGSTDATGGTINFEGGDAGLFSGSTDNSSGIDGGSYQDYSF